MLGKIFRRQIRFDEPGRQPLSIISALAWRLLSPEIAEEAANDEYRQCGAICVPSQAYTRGALTTVGRAADCADAPRRRLAGRCEAGNPDFGRSRQSTCIGVIGISVKDLPELRDRMARIGSTREAANVGLGHGDRAMPPTKHLCRPSRSTARSSRHLYNGGSRGDDEPGGGDGRRRAGPSGLNGGPDLAQWRAERIAKAVGGAGARRRPPRSRNPPGSRADDVVKLIPARILDAASRAQ